MALRVGWVSENPNGEKQGADDFLAAGGAIEDLELFCREFDENVLSAEDLPELADEVYHGLAGEIVTAIGPHTEGHPVAILGTFLAEVGNAIGRGAFWRIEDDTHYCKVWPVVVGESSKARKGVSQGRTDALMKRAAPEWADTCLETGLSSGEGLIYRVRDPLYKETEDGLEVVDPGVSDKRVVVTESEFASPLTVMKRDGNTLSMVARNAWDDKPLQTMTKHNPDKATHTHITIIGHVTKSELLKHLTEEKLGYGIANRFMFFRVRRVNILPRGGGKSPITEEQIELLREAIEFGAVEREIPLSGEDEDGISAIELWDELYPDLSEGKAGLLGACISRAEAQVRRLATIYAVLDCSEEVRCTHLLAGLGVWQFSEESARLIFGDLSGDYVADEILESLRAVYPDGLTRTEISGLFSNNKPARRLAAALKDLEARGKIRREKPKQEGAGRPKEVFYARD
jgi:hypothetical protein